MTITLNSYIPQLRILIAFIVSPLIMPFAIYIASLMAYGIDAYAKETILTTTIDAVFYAYLLALILGGPVFYWFKTKQANNLRNLSIAGALIGLFAAVAISTMSGSVVMSLYFLLIGAGALLGVIFWFIAIYVPKADTGKIRRPRRRRRA